MPGRLCMVLLTATMVSLTGAAGAATVTEQTPQVRMETCYVGIFVPTCESDNEWTAQCPAGSSFGAWGQKPETEAWVYFNGDTAEFTFIYNDMNIYVPVMVPSISYTCVSTTASAARTDSRTESQRRLVLTRKLRSRQTSMRLRCPRGERRAHSTTAIGIVRRKRVEGKSAALIQDTHRRRVRSARMTVKVDKRLDRSHRVVAQLTLYCVGDPVR